MIRAMRLPLALLLALSLAGCVESGAHDRTVADLAAAQRAGQLKDEQIRALSWQVSVITQEYRAAQARSDALHKELGEKMQQLAAANAQLAEQLKKEEEERARLVATLEQGAAGGRDGKARPEDVQRRLAAMDARNALILEQLGKIERALGTARSEAPRATPRPSASTGDVVDPWGFGSRK